MHKYTRKKILKHKSTLLQNKKKKTKKFHEISIQ